MASFLSFLICSLQTLSLLPCWCLTAPACFHAAEGGSGSALWLGVTSSEGILGFHGLKTWYLLEKNSQSDLCSLLVNAAYDIVNITYCCFSFDGFALGTWVVIVDLQCKKIIFLNVNTTCGRALRRGLRCRGSRS